ncbi:T9SS type B sorting domain-containing protein [Chryseobacterium sp. MYb264]|uniref:T9SS type B sorting domain-containing protein n=1 Tax=Chryseobacterium sp. MYb264 TaxID=2745153 RepID=UPI002E10CB78|nr:T9SS type B sorting domain-containing protein [Chryseobacterium sp. MYb264]
MIGNSWYYSTSPTGSRLIPDIDNDSSTNWSTSADLILPAGSTVEKAYLSVENDLSAFNSVRFKAPGSNYTTLNQSSSVVNRTSTGYSQRIWDVTALIPTNGYVSVAAGGAGGRYYLANPSPVPSRMGGWSIIVVYKNAGSKYRNITIADNWRYFVNSSVTTNITGIKVPANGSVKAVVGVTGTYGDRGYTDLLNFGRTGTALTALADPMTHSKTDVLNSSIAWAPVNNVTADGGPAISGNYTARNPISKGHLYGAAEAYDFDADIFDASGILQGSPNPVDITLEQRGLGGDVLVSGSYFISVDLAEAPVLTKNLSPTVINDGETATYTWTVTNTKSDAVVQTIAFTDTLPANIKVAAVPNASVSGGSGGTVAAVAGSGTVTVSNLVLNPGESATIKVDITNVPGQLNASCTGNPSPFTNSSANISFPSGISLDTTLMLPQCLIVNDCASVQDSSLSVCSETSSADFDLTAAEGAISPGPGLSFQYYENLSDATAGNLNIIQNPLAYHSDTKTVYVRVGKGSCFKVAELHLNVSIKPQFQNAGLSVCSDTPTGVFNLNAAEGNISVDPGVVFSYYENAADADLGNGNIITTPSAYSSASNIIYVRLTKGLCFSVAELKLTVNVKPVVSIIAPDTVICHNNPVTLTSSLASGNLWSTGETTQSIVVNNGGVYTLSNNDGVCESDPVAVTIYKDEDPDLQISGPASTCGETVVLTAVAKGTGNIFSWSTGDSGDTVNVNNPGTYSVTVKTPLGCEYQKSFTVSIGSSPSVHNSVISLCSDTPNAIFNLNTEEGNISVDPGVVFSYYENATDANAGNGNIIASPSAYSSGSQIIYVRVAKGICFSVAELKLTVNVKPVVLIIAPDTVICHNNPVTLTSSLTSGNLWSTGETTQSIVVSNGGVYTLSNNNGLCQSDPVDVTVYKDEDPDVQILGNLIFCEGDSTILTASANGTGNTFLWSNGVAGPVNTVTSPGLYTVKVTTPLGCIYERTVTVEMDPLIIININPPTENITCNVQDIMLDGSGSVYQPGSVFLWTATGGGNIVSGADTLTPVVNKGGTYTLTLTSPASGGCVKQSSVNVLEDTVPPPVTLTASSLIICKGDSVTLNALGAVSYEWTGIPGNAASQVVSPETTTVYTVTGTGNNGCKTSVSVTVAVVPAIVSSLHDIQICEGQKGMLDAGAGPDYTYQWNTGESTQTIEVNLNGVYTVTIDNGVCSKVYTAEVHYTKVPDIIDIAYKDNILTIKVQNNENIALQYSIDNGVSWQDSNIFYNVLKNTEYTIRVRNIRTLCDASVLYYTFMLPNVITPEGDGHNDDFSFEGISKFKNFSATIFDRYGQQLFKATPQKPVWDGKYLGRVIPTATYWYIASWEDRLSGKLFKISGWILLKNRNNYDRR